MFTHIVEFHELLCVHLLRLVKRNEFDLLWRQRFVRKGPLDSYYALAMPLYVLYVLSYSLTVKIVCSNRHQCSISREVRVQLVL